MFRSHFLSVFLLFLFSVLPTPVWSDPVIDLNEISHLSSLKQYIEYLEDPAGEFDLAQALGKNSEWQFQKEETLSFGYTSSVYWFRFYIGNSDSGTAERLMEISYPVLDDIRIEIFDAGTMTVKESWQLGDKMPFADRQLPHRHFVIPVSLEAGEKQLWVMRIETSSSMQVPLRIWEERDFFISDQNRLMGLGLYYGIMMIMVLYNLFVFMSVREDNYLYYVLYVACMAGFLASLQGLSFQYLWPEATNWNDNSIVVMLGGVVLFGSLFTRNFLFLANGAAHLNRCFGGVMLAAGMIILTANIFPYHLMIKVLIGVAVFGILLSIYAGIMRWNQGYSSARYYTIAWSSMLLGGMILAANKFNIFPRNIFTENAVQLGSALEVILLSFALADRLNQEKRERFEAQLSALEHERVARAAQAEALDQERNARAAQEKALEHERAAREAQEKALEIQKRANETLEVKVRERTSALELANRRLEVLSTTDALTEVRNRRYFDQVLEREIDRALREQETLSLLMLDVDHFKHINDDYGHQAGDEALRLIASILKQQVHRNTDLVARFGGEEFAVVLPNTPVDGAMYVAQCLRKQIEEHIFNADGQEIRLTVSIGVAGAVPDTEDTPDRFIREADSALYEAKQSGRNRVILAECYRNL